MSWIILNIVFEKKLKNTLCRNARNHILGINSLLHHTDFLV